MTSVMDLGYSYRLSQSTKPAVGKFVRILMLACKQPGVGLTSGRCCYSILCDFEILHRAIFMKYKVVQNNTMRKHRDTQNCAISKFTKKKLKSHHVGN